MYARLTRHRRRFVAASVSGLVLLAGLAAATQNSRASSAHAASTPILTLGSVTGGPYSSNLNPLSATSLWNSSTNDTWSFNYETLLQFNFGKPGDVIPWLATSYKWSDNYHALTFAIRKGVKWSDGKPFTAADVAFTFNLLKRYPALNLTGVVFSKAVANSPYSVTITLPTENIPNLYFVSTVPIVPEHIWASIKNPVTFLNPHPVVTGPYVVSSVSPQNLILTRNPLYWGTKPAFEEISQPALYTNAAAAAALDSGQSDWSDAFIAAFQQYKSTGSGTHKYQYPPLSDVFLVPNLKHYPLNLVALRKAISMVMNRSAFAAAADGNQEPAITTPTGFLLPRDAADLAPQYRSLKYKVDVAGAKALLVKAGFKYKGGTLYAPNGTVVSLPVLVNGGFSDWVAGAPIVVEELQSLGIKSSEQTPSQTQFFSDLSLGQFDLTLWATFATGPSAYYQFDQWLDSSYTAPIGKAAASNYERWSDPQTDRYLAAYDSATTSKAQVAALQGIQGIMVNDVPLIPLEYQVAWAQYTTSTVTGWYQSPSSGFDCSFCAPGNELVLLHLKPKG